MSEDALPPRELTVRVLALQGMVDFLLYGAAVANPGPLIGMQEQLGAMQDQQTDPLLQGVLEHQLSMLDRALESLDED